ncbi:MAG: YkgJ family cysteine cluster protein [bacterium]|nr:YkgJ family cysteine cluster protein [bacterium]
MMTLVEDEVGRLEAAGHEGFFELMTDGAIQLRNVQGSCFFLDGGHCRVYAIRPEGCRLYPLVLDPAQDAVFLDDYCPYREEFSFSSNDHERLRRSVEVEEEEAERRRTRTSPETP